MTSWQFHPVLVLFQLGSLVSVAVAAYCVLYLRNHGRSPLVVSVGLLAFHNAIWNAAATLKVASPVLDTKLLLYKLEFLGSGVNPSVAVVLALAYVGYGRWLSPGAVAGLALVPAVTVPLIIANPFGLMIVDPTLVSVGGLVTLEHDFTPLFTLFLAWALGATLLAGTLVSYGALVGRVPRAPAALVALALLLPVATVSLKVAGVYPTGGEGLNVTPAVNTVSLGLIALAIGRYRLFELLPVGRTRAIDVMRDGYLLIDPTGIVVDANPAARELLGPLTPGAIGTSHASDVLPVYDELDESSERITFTADDRAVQVLCSRISHHSSTEGKVLILRDVTELRARERALERKNDRLEEFVRIVSHDLRNPLNVAVGHTGLARRETDSAHLETVEHALDRMDQLIDDLLTLAHEGRATATGTATSVALPDVAHATWRTVETGDATLEIETDRSVVADDGRLQQLLENLVRNSVEHGGDDVTIRIGDLDDGFYVADDGRGIPSPDRDRVFQSGYSTNPRGTGFGLAIVTEIAGSYGWTVDVTDSEDGGARFEIRGVDVGDSPQTSPERTP